MVNILTPLAIILFNINLTSMTSNGGQRALSPENDMHHLLCNLQETWSNQGILLNNGSLNLNLLIFKYFCDSTVIEKLKECLHISLSNLTVTSCEDITQVNTCLVLARCLVITRMWIFDQSYEIKGTGSNIIALLAAIKDAAIAVKDEVADYIDGLFGENDTSLTTQAPKSTSPPPRIMCVCDKRMMAPHKVH